METLKIKQNYKQLFEPLIIKNDEINKNSQTNNNQHSNDRTTTNNNPNDGNNDNNPNLPTYGTNDNLNSPYNDLNNHLIYENNVHTNSTRRTKDQQPQRQRQEKACNIATCWKCHPEKKQMMIEMKKRQRAKQNPNNDHNKPRIPMNPKYCTHKCMRCTAIIAWIDKLTIEREEEEPQDDFDLNPQNNNTLPSTTNTQEQEKPLKPKLN